MDNLIKAGRVFYGLGIIGMAIQQFIYSDFRPVFMPPWPSWAHSSAIWAYITGAALVAAGIFIILGKHARLVSILLGSFLLFLVIFLQVSYVLFIGTNSPMHLGLWTDPLKELALSGGAFVIAGSFRKVTDGVKRNNNLISLLEKLVPLGRIFFSIMLIAFGLDHFYYTEFVSALVPSWIPWPVFWAYFAGIALIGSGVAIILNIWQKQVALLSAIMLFLWFILLHIPRAVADPYVANGNEITSVFQALAFSGVLLIIAVTTGKKSS